MLGDRLLLPEEQQSQTESDAGTVEPNVTSEDVFLVFRNYNSFQNISGFIL